ncbi:MAG: hypothetical protein F4Y86_16290 [Gammaproteobacteria bacterium]|nr:hypothetical protein [Gammaproteobacteria bacterium]MYB38114.1 hypothetical protein [Gammaproteobacteria bacterium]
MPEAERAVCELQARCVGIENAEQRQECLAAAETLRRTLAVPEALEAEPARAEAPKAVTAAEAEAEPRRGIWGRVTGLLKRDRPQSTTAPEPLPAQTADQAAEPMSDTTIEPQEPTLSEVAITRTTVDRTVLEIPEHFTGEVTAQRKLVRDRQLIAVDDRVLFEGDVWRESKIRKGDRVEVQKVSSLFGERYRIIGPSKRAVTANRIRCERVELNTDDRRKCALLPDG